MGRIEVVGLVTAVAGLLGSQSFGGLVEEELVSTPQTIISMSSTELERWCNEKGEAPEVSFLVNEQGTASCAWLDPASDRLWHVALHFHAGSPNAHQADAGLVGASKETVLRLVLNEHGTTVAQTEAGFPIWDVDLDDASAQLLVADYDEIVLVRLAR